MVKLEIYNNVGNLKENSNDYEFSFENGYIEIYQPTSCCDSWHHHDEGDDFETFFNRKYKRTSLENMKNKKILFVIILDKNPEESGEVILFSQKHYFRRTYYRTHSGYCSASFSYYTNLQEKSVKSQSEEYFNSDSDEEEGWIKSQ